MAKKNKIHGKNVTFYISTDDCVTWAPIECAHRLDFCHTPAKIDFSTFQSSWVTINGLEPFHLKPTQQQCLASDYIIRSCIDQ